MKTLAWVGIASLCLGATWAVPAKKERKKVEKPKPDLVLNENLDLDNYDMTLDSYGDIMDLNNYEELYDYGDLAPKVRGTGGHAGQGSPWCSLGKEAGAALRNGPQLVLVGYGWRTNSAPCTSLRALMALPLLLLLGKLYPIPNFSCFLVCCLG